MSKKRDSGRLSKGGKKKYTATKPVTTMDESETVDRCRYLGAHRVAWRTNSDAVYNKGRSRPHILRKLRSFCVCGKMLEIYQFVPACEIYFVNHPSTADNSKLTHEAETITEQNLQASESVMDRRPLSKVLSIMANPSHMLFSTLQRQ